MSLLLIACFVTAEASADGGCAPDAATAASVDYVEDLVDGAASRAPDFRMYVPLCATGLHEDLRGVRVHCQARDADGRAGAERWENIVLTEGADRPSRIERAIRLDWSLDDADVAEIASFQCELVLQVKDPETINEMGASSSEGPGPFDPGVARAIWDWDTTDYCAIEEDWRRQVCRRPDRGFRSAITARVRPAETTDCESGGAMDCVAPPVEAGCEPSGEMDCTPPDEGEAAGLFLGDDGDEPEAREPAVVQFAEFLEFHGGRAQDISELQAFMEEVRERDAGLYDNWYQPSAMRDSLTGHDSTPAAYRASSNDRLHDWLDDPIDHAWWDYSESGLRGFSFDHHRALDRAVDALAFEPDDDIYSNSIAYFRDGMEAWRRWNQEIDQAYFECYLSKQVEAMRLHDVYQALPWNESDDAYYAYRGQLSAAHDSVSEPVLAGWTQRPHFTWPMQTVERNPAPESDSER
jgi:hypothetical protein